MVLSNLLAVHIRRLISQKLEFQCLFMSFRDNTDIHIKLQESYLIFSIIFSHETDKDKKIFLKQKLKIKADSGIIKNILPKKEGNLYG